MDLFDLYDIIDDTIVNFNKSVRNQQNKKNAYGGLLAQLEQSSITGGKIRPRFVRKKRALGFVGEPTNPGPRI